MKGAEYKAFSPAFVMLARDNGKDHPRLGLIIAKKHIKLAVNRNQCKRLIRENFRLNLDRCPSIDIVVIARAGSGRLDKAQLWEMLMQPWQKLLKKSRSR